MSRDKIPENFDAEAYLELNPDVAQEGVDPFSHYSSYGQREGRLYEYIAGKCSPQDHLLHSNPQTLRPKFIDHEGTWKWLGENFNRKGLKVLEIGSRAVSSDSLWRSALPEVDYTGFDIQHGRNVDVIGDAHELSTYFEPNTFDVVMSFAVFEHLAVPWIVAEEISKVLKIGGVVFAETHFSFSEHELPWHFFQFNARGLEILFSKELGFETLDLGMSSPIVGRFSQYSAPYLQGKLVKDLYCHSAFAGRKIENLVDISGACFNWREVASRVNKVTSYPMDSDLEIRSRK